MWLAGQKPDVIMETCSRALAFWTYQVSNYTFRLSKICNIGENVRSKFNNFLPLKVGVIVHVSG